MERQEDIGGGSAEGAAPGPSRVRSTLQAIAPWFAAALILVYLFREVPFEEAWGAAGRARLGLFVPEVLIAVAMWFALDSRALSYLFSRFNTPVSWAEARSLRGVTYLVTAINWNVGTAAMILHLRRSKQIPALESTSSLFFYQSFDALVLTGLAFSGASMFADSPPVESIRRFAALFFGFQLLTLVLLVSSRPGWKWLQRLRGASVIRSFRLVERRDLLVLTVFRLSYFLGFIGLFWAGSHAFGIEIPLALALASAPPILMAAALPITPAGLGTQAAAMLFFWSDYGEKAEILAFGLVFPVALTLSRCLLGLFYLGDLRALRRPE